MAKAKDAKDSTVILVLQGGGALGAYHIGAYQAMHEAGYAPDWVAGTSIGAITSAALVGNPPEDRLDKLHELWHEISRPDEWGAWLPGPLVKAFNAGSAMETTLFGQPNFFSPNLVSPYLSVPGTRSATAFYDTSPMLATLSSLCDFDLINSGSTRISLGATNVRTGDIVYFDNVNPKQTIGPEHVLASGSLPPGFPATVVDGESYWDGGCVSNTPLHAILDDPPPGHALVFVVDLWSAAGELPNTPDEVSWRSEEIQYASRTAHHMKTVAARLNLRSQLATLRASLPKEVADTPGVQNATALSYEGSMDMVHVHYTPTPDEASNSPAEFSRPSIARRSAAGYADMKLAIQEAPWLVAERPAHAAAVVHRVGPTGVQQYAPAT
jgi:NTE family protein